MSDGAAVKGVIRRMEKRGKGKERKEVIEKIRFCVILLCFSATRREKDKEPGAGGREEDQE